MSATDRKIIIMKKYFLLLLLVGVSATAQKSVNETAVGSVLDSWHRAAAEADFDTYFGLMTPGSIFIGTDPTENWDQSEFKAFAKPIFDKGRAWDFKPVDRNIYFSADGKTAWFDELLDTWMKLCRGSGVLEKQADGDWKIAQYVLSIAIPNDNTVEVIKIKSAFDDKYLQELKK